MSSEPIWTLKNELKALIFQTVQNLGVMKKMKVAQEGILRLFIVLGDQNRAGGPYLRTVAIWSRAA